MTEPTNHDILDFEAMMHEGGDEGEAAYYAALDAEQEAERSVPLICPACDQLDSYRVPPTLVTCKQCGATAHVTEYGTQAGQGDDDGRGYTVMMRLPGPEGERVR